MPLTRRRSDSRSTERRYRDALGRFPTGVAVVTLRLKTKEHVGITINSFSSVSLHPPLVLWCLGRDSDLIQHFHPKTSFVVNVLTEMQRDLAVRFSRPGKARFVGVRTRRGKRGAPLLSGAAAFFECVTKEIFEGGDHVIIVGRVEAFSFSKKSALVFHGGRFHSLEESLR